ncbi:MAG: hypothetical protein ACXVP7_00285 [Actinomycetota bacterium]
MAVTRDAGVGAAASSRAVERPVLATAIAFAGAGAFVVSAVWFWLIHRHISVSAPPLGPAGASIGPQQRAYYTWMVTTLQQERFDTGIAIAAFACLMATAAAVRNRLGRDVPVVRTGTLAVVFGGALWVGGGVLQLGGHRAIGLMATHGNPIGSVNAIAFTVDIVNDAFELAAFAFIGLGMLGLAREAMRGRALPIGWARTTLLAGLLALALSVAYLADQGDLVNLLLLIGGAIVLPAWLVWSGVLVRDAEGR